MIDLTGVNPDKPQESPIRYLVAENDPVSINRMLHRIETRERLRANAENDILDALRESWFASFRKR